MTARERADVLSRVVAINCALEDGDSIYAAELGRDLEVDLAPRRRNAGQPTESEAEIALRLRGMLHVALQEIETGPPFDELRPTLEQALTLVIEAGA